MDDFPLYFNVHYGEPSHFHWLCNVISVDSVFSIAPKQIVYVFSDVLDNVREWFFHVR